MEMYAAAETLATVEVYVLNTTRCLCEAAYNWWDVWYYLSMFFYF